MPLPANSTVVGMKRTGPATVEGNQVKVKLTLIPVEQSAVKLDPLVVNHALLQLGCEVRLYWETQQFTSRSGKVHNRYVVKRGRLRLGQQDSWRKVPRLVLESSGWHRHFRSPGACRPGRTPRRAPSSYGRVACGSRQNCR